MSRLPKNVFDSPFTNTANAQVQESQALTPLQTRPLAVAVTPPPTVPSVQAPPSVRKHTVYLTDEQVLGLNERIFRMRAQGKTAREANITKVIALAVDHYLVHAD